jgi:hypothetical protein
MQSIGISNFKIPISNKIKKMEKIPGDKQEEIAPQEKPKKKMIKIICSECKAYLGEKEGVETDRDITHSYCEKCKNEALAELEKYK